MLKILVVAGILVIMKYSNTHFDFSETNSKSKKPSATHEQTKGIGNTQKKGIVR